MKMNEYERIMNSTLFKALNDLLIIRNDKKLLTIAVKCMDDLKVKYFDNFEKSESKKEFQEKLKQKKLPKISNNGKSINQVITVRPKKNSADEIFKCNECGLCHYDKEFMLEHKESHIELDNEHLDNNVEPILEPLKLCGNITMNELIPHLTRRQKQAIKDHRNKTITDYKGAKTRIRLPLKLQTLDINEAKELISKYDFDSTIYYVSNLTKPLKTIDGNRVYRVFRTIEKNT